MSDPIKAKLQSAITDGPSSHPTWHIVKNRLIVKYSPTLNKILVFDPTRPDTRHPVLLRDRNIPAVVYGHKRFHVHVRTRQPNYVDTVLHGAHAKFQCLGSCGLNDQGWVTYFEWTIPVEILSERESFSCFEKPPSTLLQALREIRAEATT
jgi:hypothetical protein